jgi:hypothetical protein
MFITTKENNNMTNLLQHPTHTDHYYDVTDRTILRIRVLKSGKQKVTVKSLTNNSNGYKSFKISIGNKKYKFYSAHRFIGECCAGRVLGSDEHLDHIDQDKHNNALSNLRIVGRSANRLNSDTAKGYYPTKGMRYQCWFRSVYQGTFDTEEEASELYQSLKAAALAVELDGVHTLQQMITEVA